MPIIIGSSTGCSISKVVSVLTLTPAFHLFRDKIGNVARELDTKRDIFQKIRKQLEDHRINLGDAVDELVEEWVGRCADGATVEELVRILEVTRMNSCAVALKKEFNVESSAYAIEQPQSSSGSNSKETSRKQSFQDVVFALAKSKGKPFGASASPVMRPEHESDDESSDTDTSTRQKENTNEDDQREGDENESDTYLKSIISQLKNQLALSEHNDDETQSTDDDDDGDDDVSSNEDEGQLVAFSDGDKAFIFHQAISHMSEEFVGELLENEKVEVLNAKNDRLETALHIASKVPDGASAIRMIQMLISHGVDVCQKDICNSTFLHHLCANGSSVTPSQFYNIAVHLVEKGYAGLFNIPGGGIDSTPFQLIVHKLEVEARTLAVLYSGGVDFNAIDNTGRTTFMYGILGGRSPQFMAAFVQYGVNLAIRDGCQRTLLHLSIINGDEKSLPEITQLLVSRCVDVNAVDINGNSALMCAITSKKSTNYLNFLVQRGADWRRLTKHGSGVLHLAAEMGTLEALQYFLSSRILNLHWVDGDGDTVLHCAVTNEATLNVVEKVKLLLCHGACRQLVNKRGLTPYMLAKTINHESQVMAELQYLLQ